MFKYLLHFFSLCLFLGKIKSILPINILPLTDSSRNVIHLIDIISNDFFGKYVILRL